MYTAAEDRYGKMLYRRAGESGLEMPVFTLGFWHNFGESGDYEEMRRMVYTAFDNGVTSFDLANNYGPPGGEAERNFGRILKDGLSSYRDEIIISTKAGYPMWPGPYGKGGGKKYLVSSLDQSLKRMGLDYVDIFYHHCPDPDTPMVKGSGGVLMLEKMIDDVSFPCVLCGKCVEHCPMGLMPNKMFRNIKYGNYQAAMDYGLMDCKECGCCAFSCPSHIPLVQGFKLGKKMGRKAK